MVGPGHNLAMSGADDLSPVPGTANLWPMPDTAGADVAVIIPARNEQLRIAAAVQPLARGWGVETALNVDEIGGSPFTAQHSDSFLIEAGGNLNR